MKCCWYIATPHNRAGLLQQGHTPPFGGSSRSTSPHDTRHTQRATTKPTGEPTTRTRPLHNRMLRKERVSKRQPCHSLHTLPKGLKHQELHLAQARPRASLQIAVDSQHTQQQTMQGGARGAPHRRSRACEGAGALQMDAAAAEAHPAAGKPEWWPTRVHT